MRKITTRQSRAQPRFKHAIRFGLAALLVVALGNVTAFPQTGYDRPGGDYTSASVANGDPMVCAARCERDKKCRAWSFSYPSSGAPAMCWLKREVVPAKEASCCVSGVRGAGVIVWQQRHRRARLNPLGLGNLKPVLADLIEQAVGMKATAPPCNKRH